MQCETRKWASYSPQPNYRVLTMGQAYVTVWPPHMGGMPAEDIMGNNSNLKIPSGLS